MTEYIYKITNSTGESRTGQVTANSPAEAANTVKEKGWFILSLQPKKNFISTLSFKSAPVKLSNLERIVFTNHLASMIGSGAPLVEALEAYKEDDNSKASGMIDYLIREIQQGRKLSEAMAAYPKIFSVFYLSLVQAGELSGSLDETLAYLSDELRREHEFKERIKSALMYPALVVSVAFMVIVLLVFLVIPRITELTKSFGGDLPMSTRIISGLASSLVVVGPIFILLLIVVIVSLAVSLKNPKSKAKLDPYLLRLPIIGKIQQKYILARFLRIVGSCLKYGVLLTASFNTVGEVVNNSQYRQACNQINDRIKRGVSLSEALTREGSNLFPKLIVRTIRGAERTGNIDAAMLRLSGYYEADIDRSLKRLTDLIEPVLVVGLGIMVGGIAIAVIAPIYQMTSKIK